MKNVQDNTQSENRKSQGRKILVIEDDKFLSRALNDKLSMKGYQVELAFSGKEALEKIMTQKPDLILLDIMLPHKNGFQILEEMKRSDDLKNIPVIVLSNLGQESDIARAKELGANDYFVKADTPLKILVQKVDAYF